MATALEDRKAHSGLRREETGLAVRIQKRLTESFHLDLEFRVPMGITILFGASGAGKTTLLDAIAGLQTPDRGHIRVGERVLFDSENHINLSIRKREIGYVFQDLALFPHLTVEENVEYGLRRLDPHPRRERVEQALASLGILALRQRRPAQLSGGERQRVALARALVTRPSLLLLDEPLAALDVPVRMKIADDLRRTIQNLPIPVLYVTHSRDEVFMLGERLLVVEHGRLIAQGTPHAVLSAPRAETVAQLAGFENIFDVEVQSVHEERGTMTCRVFSAQSKGTAVEFETPLVRAQPGTRLKVGISAGDVLLATSAPLGLSARNIVPGRLISLEERDSIIVAHADCGIELAIHLTLGARDSLGLAPGRQVWVIFKTHSCHLLAEDVAG